jgi:hypothetical protein
VAWQAPGAIRELEVAVARRSRAWRPGVVAWTLWALLLPGAAALPWFDHLIRQAGRPDLRQITPDVYAYLAGVVSAVTIGAVLASRRPRHPVGWLLMGLGLSLLAAGVATGYATYGLLARPGALPGAAFVAIYPNAVAVYLTATSLAFILLLTPTGVPPAGRSWRWWARLTVAALVVGVVTGMPAPMGEPFESVTNPLRIPALDVPLGVLESASFTVTGLAILAGAWSLVLRFRRARGVERLQLRWLALAAALVAADLLVLVLLLVAGVRDPILLGWATAVCVALLPLATGAAILRYRLYDLDRIISRTVAYGLLTVLLGGGYAVVVLGFGELLGQESSLVVAGATLAVAALFQPVRRRVQQAVDRRFNRRRYDASRTIMAFSARLRDEIDLDTLSAEVLAVVEETMQPTAASLWLRPAVEAS